MVLDAYDLQRELGRGAFGVVHLAARRTDGELFAIKILEFDELGTYGRVPDQVGRLRRRVDQSKQPLVLT